MILHESFEQSLAFSGCACLSVSLLMWLLLCLFVHLEFWCIASKPPPAPSTTTISVHLEKCRFILIYFKHLIACEVFLGLFFFTLRNEIEMVVLPGKYGIYQTRFLCSLSSTLCHLFSDFSENFKQCQGHLRMMCVI